MKKKAGDYNEQKEIVVKVISFVLIFILSRITYYIDKRLLKNNSQPIFVVYVNTTKDGGSSRYVGIGYEVIHFNTINCEENNLIEAYEINRFPNFKGITPEATVEVK